MTAARLNASVEVSALMRRAQAEGDFATVLHKGDAERGSILIVVRSRGDYISCLERTLDAGGYSWMTAGPDSATDEKVAQFLAGRIEFDPDIWLIELDVAQPERFIAETISEG
jgi:hypothetical protein